MGVVGQMLIFINYKLWIYFLDLLSSWYTYISKRFVPATQRTETFQISGWTVQMLGQSLYYKYV